MPPVGQSGTTPCPTAYEPCAGRYAAIAIAAVAVLVGAAPVAAFPPLPTPTTTVIEVPVGGDRVDDNLEIGPAITLQLFDGGSAGPTSPVGEPWATCVPDEDGSCWFRVPDTGSGGANVGRRFWVARTGTVPAGWFANDAFAIGAEPFFGAYTFRTLGMQGNRRIASGFDFMDCSASTRKTRRLRTVCGGGRDNPPFPSECRAHRVHHRPELRRHVGRRPRPNGLRADAGRRCGVVIC